MFVTTRMRTAYEGTTGYQPAQKWIDAGKPMLAAGQSVYGVADLNVAKTADSQFTVTYQKWMPAQLAVEAQTDNAGSAPNQVQGFAVTDQVRLRMVGRKWAIDAIDTSVREPISPPVTVSDKQTTDGLGGAQ